MIFDQFMAAMPRVEAKLPPANSLAYMGLL